MLYDINKLRVLGTTIVLLALSSVGMVVKGTTFVPVPLATQVRNSSGVLQGRFVSSSSKKVKTGEVVTEAIFKVDKVAGIAPDKITNSNNFKVLYPGGAWQDIVYKVHGTPTFTPDEEVVLFVSNGPYGFQLVNLALSKYKVIRSKNKVYLQNAVFPDHAELGSVSFAELNELLEARFGLPLQKVVDRHVSHTRSENKNLYTRGRRLSRGIASTSSAEEPSEDKFGSSESDSNVILWIVLIFALLGGVPALISRSERK